MTRRVLLVEIGTAAELPVVTPPAPRPPSQWVPNPRPSPGLPPPTGLAAASVADGAVLTWTPAAVPGAVTVVETAPDAAGTPGIWRTLDRTEGDTWTLGLPAGPVWARVRAELNGRTSVATNAVLATPVRVGESVTELELELRAIQELANAVADQAAADAIALNQRADGLRTDLDATVAEIATITGAAETLQTELTRVETQAIERDTATTATVALLGAKNAAGTAFVLDQSRVEVAPGETLAQWRSSVQGEFGGLGSRVDAEVQARQNADDAHTAAIQTAQSTANNAATRAELTQAQDTLASATQAVASDMTLLGARAPDGQGWVLNNSKVMVDPGLSLAEWRLGMQAEFDGKAATGYVQHVENRVAQTEAGLQISSAAIEQVRASLTGSGNLLRDADFSSPLNQDWHVIADNWGAWVGYNLGGPDWTVAGRRAITVTVGGTPGSYVVIDHSHGVIAVTPGERMIASCYLAAHRCVASLEVIWFNSGGGQVDSQGIGNQAGHSGGNSLTGWNRASAVIYPPAGAAFCTLRLVASGATSDTPFAWFLMPMLERVGPVQSTPSPWSTGGNELASVTQAMRAEVDTLSHRALAAWVLAVTAGGDIAGMELLAGGGRSAIRMLASIFEITDPAGTSGYTHSNGISIWRKGGHMTVIGPGFGAGNEFAYWFGPDQTNLNNCTRATGIRWDTVTGLSYSLGAKFSGTITAGGYTTSLAAASYSTGVFGSNGGPIVVNASFTQSRRQNGGRQGFTKNTITAGSGVTRSRIELWRSVGGGALQLVASAERAGVMNITNDPDPDIESYVDWNNTVSLTHTDNAGGTASRNFEVRLIESVFQSVTITGGAPVPAPTNSLSLGVGTSE